MKELELCVYMIVPGSELALTNTSTIINLRDHVAKLVPRAKLSVMNESSLFQDQTPLHELQC